MRARDRGSGNAFPALVSSAATLFEREGALRLNCAKQLRVQAVPASIGDEMPHKVAPGKGQITDHVEKLVADAFVGKPKRIIDRPFRTEDE